MAAAVIRWSLTNRAVVILLTILFTAGGVFAALSLNQELFPDLSLPTIFVVTVDPGASPGAVDHDVSKPISDALNGLPHLSHVNTTSSESVSTVRAQFDLGTQVRDNQDAVSQALSRVALPAGVKAPTLRSFSFADFPSITYTLAATDGDLSRATREATDIVVPALKGAKGVADVQVTGGAQNQVLVLVDAAKLTARGLAISQVTQALAGYQVSLPAGEVQDSGRTVPVQVSSTLASVEELKQFPVASTASATFAPGRPGSATPSTAGLALAPVAAVTRLSDISTISLSSAPVSGIARTDGSPSLQISVLKASGANTVTLSDDIHQRVQGLKLDGADHLRLLNDQADAVRASLSGLVEEGLIGALLAVLVIYLFLGSLRATLVTAVSLPTSVLVALLGTRLLGYSLNVMTLAGLTIAIGRVVDDAIVVLENSFSYLQKGLPPREAALQGASQVASPVLSTSLTTVAVFLPIAFTGGIVGQFFQPFAITVTISLLASLVVSLTIVPVLVSMFLGHAAHAKPGSEPLGWVLRPYRRVLTWVLARPRHKATVLASVFVMLVLAGIGLTRVPVTFFPSDASTTLTGTVTLSPGTSSEATSRALAQFEDQARSDPQVSVVQVSVSGQGDVTAFNSGGSNVGSITILLKDKKQSTAATDRLKKLLEADYGAGSVTLQAQQMGPPAASFAATISGGTDAARRQASDEVVQALRADADLTNVKSALSLQQPQVTVTIDRSKADSRHLTPQAAAFATSQVLAEQAAGALSDGTKIAVRVDTSSIDAQTIGGLSVAPGTRLEDIASVALADAPESITRQDGAQRVAVSADFTAKDTNTASRRASQRLTALRLPDEATVSTGGTSADITSSFVSLFYAMGAGLALVFIILVLFFRSVITPFVILLTVPLSVIGSFLALAITGQALGVPALMGVLMVSGIVVSNAVLLIHFAEERRAVAPLRQALLEAGSARLRPILMTAIATVVALVPLAVGLSGSGGLISQSLAVVVEGGLISSTVLTLVVIPVVYSLVRRGIGGAGGLRVDEPVPVLEGSGAMAQGRLVQRVPRPTRR